MVNIMKTWNGGGWSILYSVFCMFNVMIDWIVNSYHFATLQHRVERISVKTFSCFLCIFTK